MTQRRDQHSSPVEATVPEGGKTEAALPATALQAQAPGGLMLVSNERFFSRAAVKSPPRPVLLRTGYTGPEYITFHSNLLYSILTDMAFAISTYLLCGPAL